MQLAVITIRQVVILFFMIAAGFACAKFGVVKKEAKQAFSDLLVGVVVPCMVINSYLTPFDPQTLNNLFLAYGLSILLLVVGGAVTFFCTARTTPEHRPILRFACIYSNAAYMGFPLISVLFGSEGLLYASVFVTIFNILLWTQGVLMLQGTRLNLRQTIRTILTTPVLLAVAAGLVLYLTQIPVPELIRSPLEMIGNMNTPLSMFITGMMIAESDLKGLLSRKDLMPAVLIRLVLIPVVCFVLYRLWGLRGMAAQVVLLLEACPCAAITSVFAIRFGGDEELAAGTVVASTL
ncbi:MAG TPA: AEC family transporter, partial [Subdoligranulum variabile]|nr:AEC family transporter [Subdoligranulum variabile]